MIPTPPYQRLLHCADCGRRTTEPFWQLCDGGIARARCSDCARWFAESFTAAAAILEAVLIIRAHQQLLNSWRASQ